MVEASQAIDCHRRRTRRAQIDDPLATQLFSGELALTLASLFPELGDCRALALSARSTLDAGFAELLDGEGLPHRRVLSVLGPLLASWTRCRALGPSLAGGCWSDATEVQFAGLVQYALRLCRSEERRCLPSLAHLAGSER